MWAKSRHHGPTNWDGPNPELRGGAHIRRLLFAGDSRHAAKIYAFAALFLLAAGFIAGAVPDVHWFYRSVLWTQAPVMAFGNPASRHEVLGILTGAGVLALLLWCFLGRNF